MDVGFARAGFTSMLACEIDRDATETYNLNSTLVGHAGERIKPTSVLDLRAPNLPKNADVVFGGPPCQGFSVAGKMDPADARSELVHSFFDIVDIVNPQGFVCENVKALACSDRWSTVRDKLLNRAGQDYATALVVLNASNFGVPQIRERMFLIGIRKDLYRGSSGSLEMELKRELSAHQRRSPTVAEVIRNLGHAGSEGNPATCTAKISYAKAPVLRKSPYAGMLFNGAGRPLPTTGFATTLPASMGGNKTPIVDEREIFDGCESFIEAYHAELISGAVPRSGEAPSRLRRLTIRECMAIQTFPKNFQFYGRKSSVYRQIGNAVPCDLAEAVARSYRAVLEASEARAAGKVA